MQRVEIGVDTKLCRDISRLFKDYLVILVHNTNNRLNTQFRSFLTHHLSQSIRDWHLFIGVVTLVGF